jgi:hypothetical protein
MVERRPGFPSWSWLGWQISTAYPNWYETGQYETFPGNQRVYEARRYLSLPDGADLNAKFAIVESAEWLPSLSTDSGELRLTTQIASLDISFVPSNRADMVDRWVLLDADGQHMHLNEDADYVEGLGDPTREDTIWPNRGTDSGALPAPPKDCWIFPPAALRESLRKQNAKCATFVFLQRWKQIATDRQTITEYNDPQTGVRLHRWPYVSRGRNLGDRVWLMMLHPNDNGLMERAALVFIPTSYWQSVEKQSQTVIVV